MGAPNPMGIAECAPTVKKVLRDLSRGKPFPVCHLQNGLESKTQGTWVSYTRAGLTPRCPSGSQQGVDGVVYFQGAMPNGRRSYINVSNGVTNLRLTDDDWRGNRGNYGDYSRRVCLSGNKLGEAPATYPLNDRDEPQPKREWWETIQIMNPDGATYQFDFYVDNALYSSHRF